MAPPKVVVLMQAYNHGRFIAQAIESVLMQKVSFPYELVIGEDCSTDDTAAIVADFQQRYPDRIRGLLATKNVGGPQNFVRTFRACRGTYLALLDGDDFWTSPEKLQRQVDFLDANPDFSACGHKVDSLYDDPSIKVPPIPLIDKEVLTLEDMLDESYLPASSLVFRHGLWGTEIPSFIPTLPMGDWPINILNATFGKAFLFPSPWGVYRKHSGGAWTAMRELDRWRGRLRMYEAIDEYLGRRYHREISTRITRTRYHLGWEAIREGDLAEAGRQAKRLLRSPATAEVSWRRKAGLALYVTSPGLYRIATRLFRAAGGAASAEEKQ